MKVKIKNSKITVAGKTILDNRGKEGVDLQSAVCGCCDSIKQAGDLISIADNEGIGDGYTIRGYCTVDGGCSVMCTRDKVYQELGGRISDCVYAESTTKSRCEHWEKIGTPIKI